jgi:uncharacterized protein DUF1801
MPRTPATVKDYLAALPDDRRPAIAKLREVILDNLPQGYEEAVSAGMLVYQVPCSVLSETYNGHPLWYVALGSTKTYMTVHLLPLYSDADSQKKFRADFKARGKKLDMGKSCVRFKSIDDLPLDVIGGVVAKFPIDTWVRVYQQSRKRVPSKKARPAARGTRGAGARARQPAERPARRQRGTRSTSAETPASATS